MRLVASIVVLAVLFAVMTALGVFAGWALDHSELPPWGGGWRCYVGCLGIAWTPLLGAAALAALPAARRWLAEKAAAKPALPWPNLGQFTCPDRWFG